MRVMILVAASLLVACQSAQGHPHKSADESKAVVSPGKPQHPIQVQLIRPAKVKAGVASEAALVINSALQLEEVAVRLQPEEGMMLSQDRFGARNGSLLADGLTLPFTVTPAAEEDQSLKVFIQARMPDGRLISREIELPLSGTPETMRAKGARSDRSTPTNVDAPAEKDVVVPARQEVIHDDDNQ